MLRTRHQEERPEAPLPPRISLEATSPTPSSVTYLWFYSIRTSSYRALLPSRGVKTKVSTSDKTKQSVERQRCFVKNHRLQPKTSFPRGVLCDSIYKISITIGGNFHFQEARGERSPRGEVLVVLLWGGEEIATEEIPFPEPCCGNATRTPSRKAR